MSGDDTKTYKGTTTREHLKLRRLHRGFCNLYGWSDRICHSFTDLWVWIIAWVPWPQLFHIFVIDRSKAISPLQFFFVRAFMVCYVAFILSLFVLHVSLINFVVVVVVCALGGLYFVIVTFCGYVHLYFCSDKNARQLLGWSINCQSFLWEYLFKCSE